MLSERFGGTPFDYWNADALERERLLELLMVEGEVARAYEGLTPDDEVVFMEDDVDAQTA